MLKTLTRKSILKSPKYKKLRSLVFKLDHYTCTLCGKKGSLEMHHIKPWAKFPKLRFDANNTVTLCYRCHQYKVTRREEQYEDFLSRAIKKRTARVAFKKTNLIRKLNARNQTD